jgi:hypothetical protein
MPRQRRRDYLRTLRDMQRGTGAGEAGVEQLAAEHAGVHARQLQPDLVELAALGLVHGGGEGGLVRGQRGGVEGADLSRSKGRM